MNQIQASVFYKIEPHFAHIIEEMLQQLLNTKHLYQNVRVILPDRSSVLSLISPDLATMFGKVADPTVSIFNTAYDYALGVEWSIRDPNERRFAAPYITDENVSIAASISINPLTIRCYCHYCGNVEPYNYTQGCDVLSRFPYEDPTTQVFALAYQCQGCKGLPNVFFVRRDDTKLTLCGRSPIEKVIVAPQIPRSHIKFISDATVAFNSGQILAGIFLLRVFIEQYVRSKSITPDTTDIDSLFSEYGSTLLNEFKSHFPSLKSIYDDLSTAIHAADPSEQVYSKAKEEIEHHFDGKRAFRISE